MQLCGTELQDPSGFTNLQYFLGEYTDVGLTPNVGFFDQKKTREYLQSYTFNLGIFSMFSKSTQPPKRNMQRRKHLTRSTEKHREYWLDIELTLHLPKRVYRRPLSVTL